MMKDEVMKTNTSCGDPSVVKSETGVRVCCDVKGTTYASRTQTIYIKDPGMVVKVSAKIEG